MTDAGASRVAMRAREVAWRRTLLSLGEQALVDVAGSLAVEVTFVAHEDRATAAEFLGDLEAAARARGFVTARQALHVDGAFDSLDVLVRAVAMGLDGGGAAQARGAQGKRRLGVVSLLDAFVRTHGRRALAAFDANAARAGAAGNLVALARAYLEAASGPRRELVQLEAWLNGVELGRADADAVAVSALSERTAKRVLGELTRLVRVLDYAGCLLVFTDADRLTKLPPTRRENSYTVLRELVDNADGGRGLVATKIVVAGSREFFEGARSVAALAPLASRIQTPAGSSVVPPPHRPIVQLEVPEAWGGEEASAEPAPVPERKAAAMRALIRASQGLPPVEAVLSMSVGHERIDAAIDQLFSHSAMDGSVFALLTGAYGAGKTHLLLHLAARALADRRPVLRLSLERLDVDLGNPQRHLRRLLEGATLPLTGGPGPLDRLATWTRSPAKMQELLDVLRAIAAESGDASPAAERALRNAARAKSPAAAVESFLGAQDLEPKPGGAGYRLDAYSRLLLWFELLERIERCAGPVLLIDEAENLYRGGTSRAERRTALRSLAFYCGGTLPRACVIMAITPVVLDSLRAESKELLDEIGEQRTVLAWEDASMLRRRLLRIKPEAVPVLTDAHKGILAERVRATFASVRGRSRADAEGGPLGRVLVESGPREVVRRVADALEAAWWARRVREAPRPE